MAILPSFSRAKWTGVPGTWATNDTNRWWEPDSPFSLYLQKLGILPLKSVAFIWSTNLEGLFPFWGSKRHKDWIEAGDVFRAYLADTPVKDRNVIAHSHALQAVLYACSKGLQLNSLTSVSSPVRKDMEEVAEKARPHIGYWTHIHSDSSDRIQWLGELLDGHFGKVRKHPLADLNVGIPKVGHSDLLRKSEHFHNWNHLLYPITQNYGSSKLSGGSSSTG
jgi:hypothetical protein